MAVLVHLCDWRNGKLKAGFYPSGVLKRSFNKVKCRDSFKCFLCEKKYPKGTIKYKMESYYSFCFFCMSKFCENFKKDIAEYTDKADETIVEINKNKADWEKKLIVDSI